VNKQYNIHQDHPNLISYDLIEDDKVIGGYIVPNNNDTKKFMIGFLKREGYECVKVNNNGTKKI